MNIIALNLGLLPTPASIKGRRVTFKKPEDDVFEPEDIAPAHTMIQRVLRALPDDAGVTAGQLSDSLETDDRAVRRVLSELAKRKHARRVNAAPPIRYVRMMQPMEVSDDD